MHKIAGHIRKIPQYSFTISATELDTCCLRLCYTNIVCISWLVHTFVFHIKHLSVWPCVLPCSDLTLRARCRISSTPCKPICIIFLNVKSIYHSARFGGQTKAFLGHKPSWCPVVHSISRSARSCLTLDCHTIMLHLMQCKRVATVTTIVRQGQFLSL